MPKCDGVLGCCAGVCLPIPMCNGTAVPKCAGGVHECAGGVCPLNAMSGLVGMLAGITMGNHGMHAGAHMGAHGVRAGVPVGCHDVHTGAPLGGHGCTRAWHSLKPLFLPKRG